MTPPIFSALFQSQLRSNSKATWRKGWICAYCMGKNRPRIRFSSSTAATEKPYYITTPIFYVNAAPHVGHFYTMVLTDILKRWQLLKGRRAILCTGTDEHGMKIQRAAALANTPPKEFCDMNAETFKNLVKRAGIANDHFVRTTDEDHKEAVQYFWQMLRERGYIYESKHEGWYCVSDETYYPESAIEKRLDPFTGKTFIASQETGKEVEWTSERNYHFRLSLFKEPLLKFYKENPEFVVPISRMKDVVRWVEEGLEDLSISRPVERLTWGVRVPDDETQTIYVWLDALINYITKAGYPWAPGKESAGGWPADVQVIGKDIVRFHCIYWPAFLLALGLKPPKQILTHAHWTLGHQKMAKSTGNVVNPFFALDRFGLDAMRYYLAHDGGIADDADYGNDYIVEKYKKGLQGGLGNLVSRITRPKIWSVPEAVKSYVNKTMAEPEEMEEKQIEIIQEASVEASRQFENLNPGAALQAIMGVVYETNKYLTFNEPWKLAKQPDLREMLDHIDGEPVMVDANQKRVERTIFHSAEALRIVGILLQPFIPEKAAKLLDMLGVQEERRTYDFAKFGVDDSYGTPKFPPGKGAYDALFPPLPVED